MILFLYGEDSYRSRKKLKQIEEKFKKTDKSRVNFVRIDGERTVWRNIEKEIVAPPFLHDKKLIVIENFLKKKGQKSEEAVDFLRSNKIPGGTVIVFWEGDKPDERTGLFKALNKPGQAERFNFLPLPKLNQWIDAGIKARGVGIERQAVDLLAELVGPDLWQLEGEIEKLTAYCRGRGKEKGEKNTVVTADDVRLLVRGKFDEDIFSLIDAIGARNKKQVFKILNEQIEAGVEETRIFLMLVWQLRVLLQVKEVVSRDYAFLSPADPGVKQKISAELGLHPYVVGKALGQVKRYSPEELKKIYKKLLACDIKMKRSGLDRRLLLDLLINEILLS